MPLYEYECRSCSQRFERKQSFSEDPVKVCPSCGGEVRRVLHAPGIVFKGSGWYVPDSRKSTESSSPESGPSSGPTSPPAPPGTAGASGGSGSSGASDAAGTSGPASTSGGASSSSNGGSSSGG